MAQAQWHETRAHVFQNYQCQIRLMVKLRFLVGIARKIAEINGIINYPQVRDTLGLLAAKATGVEGMVVAMEAAGEQYGEFYVPDRAMLAASQVLSQELYPEVVETIRTLAGGGLIMLPSSARDFSNPESARVIDKTQRSSIASPKERVKLFKLAWDAIGSEFGSRHLQYEMFYSGPPFVTRGHAYRFFDWLRSERLIDGFMATYDLPDGSFPSSDLRGLQSDIDRRGCRNDTGPGKGSGNRLPCGSDCRSNRSCNPLLRHPGRAHIDAERGRHGEPCPHVVGLVARLGLHAGDDERLEDGREFAPHATMRAEPAFGRAGGSGRSIGADDWERSRPRLQGRHGLPVRAR